MKQDERRVQARSAHVTQLGAVTRLPDPVRVSAGLAEGRKKCRALCLDPKCQAAYYESGASAPNVRVFYHRITRQAYAQRPSQPRPIILNPSAQALDGPSLEVGSQGAMTRQVTSLGFVWAPLFSPLSWEQSPREPSYGSRSKSFAFG